jgi:hypothetical protein
MQVVNFSISLPDETHPSMQVHVFGPGVSELTVEIPAQRVRESAGPLHLDVTVTDPDFDDDAVRSEADDYALGGYAGI